MYKDELSGPNTRSGLMHVLRRAQALGEVALFRTLGFAREHTGQAVFALSVVAGALTVAGIMDPNGIGHFFGAISGGSHAHTPQPHPAEQSAPVTIHQSSAPPVITSAPAGPIPFNTSPAHGAPPAPLPANWPTDPRAHLAPLPTPANHPTSPVGQPEGAGLPGTLHQVVGQGESYLGVVEALAGLGVAAAGVGAVAARKHHRQ